MKNIVSKGFGISNTLNVYASKDGGLLKDLEQSKMTNNDRLEISYLSLCPEPSNGHWTIFNIFSILNIVNN